ncbi:MAG: hypothetical protein KDA73_10700 [Rhodobacteraceae bacterium]|nr:hypothetical protein [Paracoccaceae bacterium]
MEKCFDTLVAEAKRIVSAITPAEAADLHGTEGVVFVDPRPLAAIAATTGRIPGALAVPLDAIRAGELPAEFADRSVHVVAACQAGPMGALAAAAFAAQGFARVTYVAGGTQAWLEAGRPTER